MSWSGGVGRHELWCTDEQFLRAENLTCLGADAPVSVWRTAVIPAAVQLSVDGFFSRRFGVGGRLLLHQPIPSGLSTDRSPGTTLQLQFGPQLRLLSSVASGGRAGWLRGEIRFAASLTRMSPLAGSAKYGEVRHSGYLDAGTFELRHVGVAVGIEGAIELAPKAVLVMSGRYSWYAPMPGTAARQVREPATVELTAEAGGPTHPEDVIIMPELARTSQMLAGGRIGVLLPTKATSIAVGPFIAVDFLRATMSFPNAAEDCWMYDAAALQDPTEPPPACTGSDGLYRKVYSARRHELYVLAGIEARFGVSNKTD